MREMTPKKGGAQTSWISRIARYRIHALFYFNRHREWRSIGLQAQ